MKLAAGILWLYKATIGPLLGERCRFSPSCSEYMHDAICTHGVVNGAQLGLTRLLRCHPFSEGGFDPVPRKCEETNPIN